MRFVNPLARYSFSSVGFLIGIKNDFVLTLIDSETVVNIDAAEINDYYYFFPVVSAFVCNDVFVPIVGIDPLESVPTVVVAVQSGRR